MAIQLARSSDGRSDARVIGVCRGGFPEDFEANQRPSATRRQTDPWSMLEPHIEQTSSGQTPIPTLNVDLYIPG